MAAVDGTHHSVPASSAVVVNPQSVLPLKADRWWLGCFSQCHGEGWTHRVHLRRDAEELIMKMLLGAAIALALTACGNGSSTGGDDPASTSSAPDASIVGDFDVGKGKK